jgi:hypothetical protein
MCVIETDPNAQLFISEATLELIHLNLRENITLESCTAKIEAMEQRTPHAGNFRFFKICIHFIVKFK